MNYLKKIQQKTAPQGPDVPLGQAVQMLRNEVVEEVKKLATGKVHSVYQIVEMAKELIELEEKQLVELKQKAKADLMAEF